MHAISGPPPYATTSLQSLYTTARSTLLHSQYDQVCVVVGHIHSSIWAIARHVI